MWYPTIVADNLWYLSKWRPFWRHPIWVPFLTPGLDPPLRGWAKVNNHCYRFFTDASQRRIFIFGALLNWGPFWNLYDWCHTNYHYMCSLHSLKKLFQFIHILLCSELPRYQKQNQSQWNKRKSQRWSYLTTLTLHMNWVPHLPRAISKMASDVFLHTLYVHGRRKDFFQGGH